MEQTPMEAAGRLHLRSDVISAAFQSCGMPVISDDGHARFNVTAISRLMMLATGRSDDEIDALPAEVWWQTALAMLGQLGMPVDRWANAAAETVSSLRACAETVSSLRAWRAQRGAAA